MCVCVCVCVCVGARSRSRSTSLSLPPSSPLSTFHARITSAPTHPPTPTPATAPTPAPAPTLAHAHPHPHARTCPHVTRRTECSKSGRLSTYHVSNDLLHTLYCTRARTHGTRRCKYGSSLSAGHRMSAPESVTQAPSRLRHRKCSVCCMIFTNACERQCVCVCACVCVCVCVCVGGREGDKAEGKEQKAKGESDKPYSKAKGESDKPYSKPYSKPRRKPTAQASSEGDAMIPESRSVCKRASGPLPAPVELVNGLVARPERAWRAAAHARRAAASRLKLPISVSRCVHVRTQRHIQTHIHIHELSRYLMYAHTHAHTHAHTNTNTCVHTYAHRHTQTHTLHPTVLP